MLQAERDMGCMECCSQGELGPISCSWQCARCCAAWHRALCMRSGGMKDLLPKALLHRSLCSMGIRLQTLSMSIACNDMHPHAVPINQV